MAKLSLAQIQKRSAGVSRYFEQRRIRRAEQNRLRKEMRELKKTILSNSN